MGIAGPDDRQSANGLVIVTPASVAPLGRSSVRSCSQPGRDAASTMSASQWPSRCSTPIASASTTRFAGQRNDLELGDPFDRDPGRIGRHRCGYLAGHGHEELVQYLRAGDEVERVVEHERACHSAFGGFAGVVEVHQHIGVDEGTHAHQRSCSSSRDQDRGPISVANRSAVSTIARRLAMPSSPTNDSRYDRSRHSPKCLPRGPESVPGARDRRRPRW